MTRSLFVFLLPCVLAGLMAAQAQPRPDVGINVGQLKDYNGDVVFVDVFRQARAWISQYTHNDQWANPTPLDLDPNGWPASLESGQAAGTLLFNALDGHYPAGRYVVLHDGSGTFEFRFDARVVSSTPGRIVLDVTPSDLGMHVKIVQTDPADPIRDVRIVMEDHEATYMTQPFYPPFLEFLQPFALLRFMDWQETNNSDVSAWSDRTTPETYTQTLESGVALEFQIELANALRADPWFTIPHLATDDYVRQFAEMVAAELDPSLTAYVEYSNEVWNFQFEQANYARDRGAAEWPELGDVYTAHRRFYSKRSVEIFGLFEEAFGGLDRLERVMAWQNPHAFGSNEILAWENAGEQVDVLAVAPYFDGPPSGTAAERQRVEAMSVDQILDWAKADIDTTLAWATDQKAVADQYGLRFLAYEGGQHLVGPHDADAVTTLFTAANRAPRMGDLYRQYLEAWGTISSDPIVLYNAVSQYGPSGSWGLAEYTVDDPAAAPKYAAVLDYLSTDGAIADAPRALFDVSVAPHPVRDHGTLWLDLPVRAVVEITPYDGLGREVGRRAQGVYPPGSTRIALDTLLPAHPAAGTYFLRIRADGHARTLPVVVAP